MIKSGTEKNETDMRITYDSTLDKANKIAMRDIKMSIGQNRCGCLGVVPDSAVDGYVDGVWLNDAIWVWCDAILYWTSSDEARDYLYSETLGALGVIPFFANLQETEGEHAGNIPVAKYIKGHLDYEIDYGGLFDLAYSPRKNYRDEVSAGAFFIHAMHRYWKLFNDTSYITKYYRVMQKYMEYREKGIDNTTNLFKSTYGLADVCIDYATWQSCALIRVNGECFRMFARFSEIAETIGKKTDAEKYRTIAYKVKKAINIYLWQKERSRYEIKIFHTPTTNKNSPAYRITEDHHFFVVGNMALLYFGIPDDETKTKSLIAEIEKADGGLKLYGQSVEPPYPDGWHHSPTFDSGNYWNGDVWPSFASWYAIALFRLGYPDKAMDVLTKQARVAGRDGGFYEFYEDDAKGAGKGAFHFVFTAAAYQRALVEGLFGLEADYPKRKVCIHPSLRHSGSIICQLGRHRADMVVEIDNAIRAIKLSINTTYSGPADFRILIEDSACTCEVTKNGKTKVISSLERIGDEKYAVFTSELNSGTNVFNLSYS